MHRRTRLVIGGVALSGVGLAAWFVSPAVALDRFETLSSAPLLFAVVLFAVAIIRPVFAWPTLLLSIGVGYAYGVAGLPLALGGLVLTSLPPYWFGRSGLEPGRLTSAGQTLLAEAGGIRGVTAARLFPVPSDVISVAAGAVGVRLRAFVIGTLLGELPWAVLGLIVGQSVDHLTTGELSGAVDPWLLAGMTAVAVVLLAGPCYRLLSTRRAIDFPSTE
jgi:uncharacterized membrane protein YdjX (TVP38/TMEM64 family)